jgi:PUA domain protein
LKSNLISKSETNDILKEIYSQWHIDLPKMKNLRVYHLPDDVLLISGEHLISLKLNDDYIPYLSETKILEKLPYVLVDMGAVKFMCNGANVMRPGIRKYSEFGKNEIVCVKEESQQKFLAIGKSFVASSELENIEKGEVLKNIHYISDKFWEIGKTLSIN